MRHYPDPRSTSTRRARPSRLDARLVSRLFGLALAHAAFLQPHLAFALTWDSSGSHPASPVAGPGFWNNTDPLWTDGVITLPWNNNVPADFAGSGTGGLITINEPSGNITANSLTFQTTGYT